LLDLGIPELIIQQALAATHLQLAGSPLRRPRWGIDRSLKPHRKPNDLENHEKQKKTGQKPMKSTTDIFFTKLVRLKANHYLYEVSPS